MPGLGAVLREAMFSLPRPAPVNLFFLDLEDLLCLEDAFGIPPIVILGVIVIEVVGSRHTTLACRSLLF